MTSAPSAQHQDQLTLFAADSLAKTSAKPGKAPAWLARDRACSTNCSESFAWWDRNTSSWKTSQRSLTEEWTTFSERWPRQGMTRNGRAYRQRLWVPAISVIGGGALPTPKAGDGERGRDKARARPDLKGRELATVLQDQLPTPRTCSAMAAPVNSRGNLEGERFPNLETVIGRQLLTPCASDWKGRTNWVAAGRNGPQRLADSVPTGGGMYLNPSFVEEMMGFPVGWTDLKP